MRPKETKICGLSAVRARFQRDPKSIQRLYFDYETGRKIGMICRVMAVNRTIYRCVEPVELEKVSGTLHHGGIVAVVAAMVPKSIGDKDITNWVRRREPLVVLDRVGNAHNLGAIARTAAFFGVPRLVLSGESEAAQPGDSAYRVSEGGMEFLEIWTTKDTPALARALAAAGFDVAGAATRSGAKPMKAISAGPWALFLGNEVDGLAPEVSAACTRLITIPGKGSVESLNVSAAAAILLSQLTQPRDSAARWHERKGTKAVSD